MPRERAIREVQHLGETARRWVQVAVPHVPVRALGFGWGFNR